MVSTNFLKISRKSQQKNAQVAEKNKVFFTNPKSNTQLPEFHGYSPGLTTW